MRLFILTLLIFSATSAYSQHTIQFRIVDADSDEPLPGATATLEGTDKGGVADTSGLLTITNIPAGEQNFVISYVGYQSQERTFEVPVQADEPIQVALEEGEELEEVVVTATRSSRTIDDIPTRIEVLTAEELGEKAVMNSTNIAMLLRESTGILMQQTSASSANQSIRIQGLDGRYTQLLRDGFPLYAGFAGGLSIMQIPPIDLKQVEVIKGSASTLYGGGAIAGLVNLVTKQPVAGAPELSLMLNQTTAGGSTINAFYAERYGKAGLSMYASANRQQPYDPNEDDFSDIPKVRSLTLNPRFYYDFTSRTSLWVGVNTSVEERVGGDIRVIEDGVSEDRRFTEENNSRRVSSQLRLDHRLAEDQQFTFKNSLSFFDRELQVPDFNFAGQQWASFTEATYSRQSEGHEWIMGANLITDQFVESSQDGLNRDYQNTTFGFFVQQSWTATEQIALESGLRTDYNADFGTFVLPRVSMLIELGPKWSGRIGGGLGYSLPTIFTEAAETLTFRAIRAIDINETEAETSVGGNFDINYKTLLGKEVTLSANQLFFFTQLENALVLSEINQNGLRQFLNADAPVISRGFETNVKLGWRDFKLFLQYAFIDAKLTYNEGNRRKPLTPRHNAGAVLMFEQHGKWRIGLETYYTGPQFRSNYTRTQDFWIVGLMGLRELGRWSFFLNFENFIDTRQSRFQDIVSPPIINPTFAEIWAPVDGFVANGGFIFRFFAPDEHHDH